MSTRMEKVGGVPIIMHGRTSYDHRPSHPYNVGTEHVGFSPTTHPLLAPNAKRRQVFGESHEG